MAIELNHVSSLPRQAASPNSTASVVVRVDSALYDAAHSIAALRDETVDEVVARALKRYARGRTPPRA